MCKIRKPENSQHIFKKFNFIHFMLLFLFSDIYIFDCQIMAL